MSFTPYWQLPKEKELFLIFQNIFPTQSNVILQICIYKLNQQSSSI